MNRPASRRSFLRNVGAGSLGAVATGAWLSAAEPKPDAKILGAEGVKTSARPQGVWKPVSDRKIRVGIVGYGVCKFGAGFGFQDHPNVTVAASPRSPAWECPASSSTCGRKTTVTRTPIVSHQSALKDGELLKIPQFA